MSIVEKIIDQAMALPIWTAPHDPQILGGGITNLNVKLRDGGSSYVVRIGSDIEAHLVKRFNEQACHRASERAGLSPRIVYAREGILAMEFIDGNVLNNGTASNPEMVDRIATLLRRLHYTATRYLRGPVLAFWVFHVLRDYAARLEAEGSPYNSELASLMAVSERLEEAVGPVAMALTHNDLLPANMIDSGDKLWLIDWDYGGFNAPLFDLASIASNCRFSYSLRERLLEAYYDEPVSAARRRRFQALVCASLLRETMWSMVSEISSEIDFDYSTYTAQNRVRFDAAYSDFLNS
jgi:thiamine kinase-like enzyme